MEWRGDYSGAVDDFSQTAAVKIDDGEAKNGRVALSRCLATCKIHFRELIKADLLCKTSLAQSHSPGKLESSISPTGILSENPPENPTHPPTPPSPLQKMAARFVN